MYRISIAPLYSTLSSVSLLISIASHQYHFSSLSHQYHFSVCTDCEIFFMNSPMNKPPKTTLLFKNVPTNTTNWLVGIDTKFFNINQLLKGIKLIPNGIHFIHYSLPSQTTGSTTSALETSIRYGRWIECCDHLIVFVWDSEAEKFDILDGKSEQESLNYSKHTMDVGDVYPFTIPYPENEDLWKSICNYVDIEVIQEFIPYNSEHYSNEINTITPSKEENMVLMEKLLQHQANRSNGSMDVQDQSHDELRYTIIQFLANRDTDKLPTKSPVPVEQISNDYLDKSWYINKLYGHDFELLLGELQVAFTLFIILGNFCSGLQWINILKLLLMGKSFMNSNKSFSLNFLKAFEAQLQVLPEEYIGDNISLNSAVDTKTFISIMENFIKDIFPEEQWNQGDCCGKMKLDGFINQKWGQVMATIHRKFNIDIRKLRNSQFDDDQFEVFDLNDYDQDDEDVPAIV